MFDEDEDDDNGTGIFLLVLGLLTTILVVVGIVAISKGSLPEATVTGPAPEDEIVETTTTTTDAPAETTTTAPTTSSEAPPALADNMFQALNDSGQAGLFASLGGQLGLQADLEAIVDDDGNDVDRTLFAPSDDAIGKLSPEDVSGLLADPEAATALVSYHFLDGRFTFEDLRDLDGQTIESRTGQLISFANDGESVIINGVSRVTSGDFEAKNGIVHIVDTILDPPDNVNELIGLRNIEFEVASAQIAADSEAELQKAINFFAANPDISASIEGHTDTDGSAEGNLALSQARADSVKAFLVENGIDEGRLTTAGFGETSPILVDGVEDKVASRRIEFIVAE